MYHVVVLLTLINKCLTILMRARGYRSEGNQLKGMNRWILPYRSLMKRKILGYSNSHHIERKHFEIDFRLTIGQGLIISIGSLTQISFYFLFIIEILLFISKYLQEFSWNCIIKFKFYLPYLSVESTYFTKASKVALGLSL